ncbi:hypothetical protein C8F04DRAFT_1177121 [Mycena alexandri]|uniref:Uncharacterized protein n=1 Tax=Mycena alexandri TaxID=1745969 RepID=A0AAD6T8F2_9AGAR|nr:hypothetical protein C8F04DRAFT_1177121 [Mycena alexandri]
MARSSETRQVFQTPSMRCALKSLAPSNTLKPLARQVAIILHSVSLSSGATQFPTPTGTSSSLPRLSAVVSSLNCPAVPVVKTTTPADHPVATLQMSQLASQLSKSSRSRAQYCTRILALVGVAGSNWRVVCGMEIGDENTGGERYCVGFGLASGRTGVAAARRGNVEKKRFHVVSLSVLFELFPLCI